MIKIFGLFEMGLLVALYILNFNQLIAAQITICPNCELSSLPKAIELSENGDTLYINKGEYQVDNIIVNKSISIIGKDFPVLISKEGEEILTIIRNDVSIEGLVLRGVVTNYLKENAAIRIKKKKNYRIFNNRIEECFFGIYLEHADNGSVFNNTIKGTPSTESETGNAIHVWYCNEIKVQNNSISGHRDGIYLEFVNQSLIHLNKSFGNTRYGLHFMFSNDNSYTNNIFEENGVGVAVMFSRRIIMRSNRFLLNWGRSAYGLLLKEIYDADIIGNTFEQNTIGIFVEGSNRINYNKNSFIRNGWAVKFSGGCEKNDISQNNFINNALDLVIHSKLNDNTINRNYWSNYNGYDLDKNGIGDVPHYPVKLFSYILDLAPEAIVLLQSFFVDLVNFAEKVSPVFTPKEVKDREPIMEIIL